MSELIAKKSIARSVRDINKKTETVKNLIKSGTDAKGLEMVKNYFNQLNYLRQKITAEYILLKENSHQKSQMVEVEKSILLRIRSFDAIYDSSILQFNSLQYDKK